MKQYTNESQTAKLIELGQPKPRYYSADKYTIIHTGFDIINYSIGELIEMLGVHLSSIYCIGIGWCVNAEGLERRSEELIDALYDMVVKLKEEGVI